MDSSCTGKLFFHTDTFSVRQQPIIFADWLSFSFSSFYTSRSVFVLRSSSWGRVQRCASVTLISEAFRVSSVWLSPCEEWRSGQISPGKFVLCCRTGYRGAALKDGTAVFCPSNCFHGVWAWSGSGGTQWLCMHHTDGLGAFGQRMGQFPFMSALDLMHIFLKLLKRTKFRHGEFMWSCFPNKWPKSGSQQAGVFLLWSKLLPHFHCFLCGLSYPYICQKPQSCFLSWHSEGSDCSTLGHETQPRTLEWTFSPSLMKPATAGEPIASDSVEIRFPGGAAGSTVLRSVHRRKPMPIGQGSRWC